MKTTIIPTLALILLPTFLTALPSINLSPRDTPSCCTEAINAQNIGDTTAYNNAITACAARGCTSGGSAAPAGSAAPVAPTVSYAAGSGDSNKWQEKWVSGCSDCEGVEAPYSCYCSPCKYLPNGCV